MHMMVAGVPALVSEVNPTRERETLMLLGSITNHKRAALGEILRAAGPADLILTRWQEDMFAGGAIHLRVEEKIGR